MLSSRKETSTHLGKYVLHHWDFFLSVPPASAQITLKRENITRQSVSMK